MRKSSSQCQTALLPSVSWSTTTASTDTCSPNLTPRPARSTANTPKRLVITSCDAPSSVSPNQTLLTSIINKRDHCYVVTTCGKRPHGPVLRVVRACLLFRWRQWSCGKRALQPCSPGCHHIWQRWKHVCIQRWASTTVFSYSSSMVNTFSRIKRHAGMQIVEPVVRPGYLYFNACMFELTALRPAQNPDLESL